MYPQVWCCSRHPVPCSDGRRHQGGAQACDSWRAAQRAQQALLHAQRAALVADERCCHREAPVEGVRGSGRPWSAHILGEAPCNTSVACH